MLNNVARWLAIGFTSIVLPTQVWAQDPAAPGQEYATPTPEHVAQPVTTAPHVSAQSVLVLNQNTGQAIYEKRINQRQPIASISKLMMAMVLLDSGVPLDEQISITDAEVDRLKHTTSRLAVGNTLPRKEMLLLALMSSENRAAAALARTALPGGTAMFVERMNQKAQALGMTNTVFYDPTGLDMRNISTALDLAKMVQAADNYPLIRQFSTTPTHEIISVSNRLLHYKNSNALIRQGDWDIAVQKTGYIKEAGHCMVLQTTVGSQPMIIVILSAGGGSARATDARSIRSWLETHPQTWLAAS